MSFPHSLPNPMFDPATTGQFPAVPAPLSPGEMLAREAFADEPAPAPTSLAAPTLDELAGDWIEKYRPSVPPAEAAPLAVETAAAPRLRTWTLPNGKFVLVFDRAGMAADAFSERAAHFRDSTGAAAALVYAEEVDVLDADVLVEDVPVGLRAEDEALVRHLREFATGEVAQLRRQLDEARVGVNTVHALHEAASRDLTEALDRMRRARELARAHGQAAIVNALTLPEDSDEGTAPAAEVAA